MQSNAICALILWQWFQVLYLYFLLGVQDLLRLWFYAISICYSHDRDGVRHYCMYIFLAERRRLSMVSLHIANIRLVYNASIFRRQWTSFLAAASTAGYVYIYSFYYFFFKTKWADTRWYYNNFFVKSSVCKCFSFLQNVRSLPNGILLRLHGVVQPGSRYHVRNGWIHRHQRIRAKDILHGQDRLNISLIKVSFVSWITQCNSCTARDVSLLSSKWSTYFFIYPSAERAVRHAARECDFCFSAFTLVIDLTYMQCVSSTYSSNRIRAVAHFFIGYSNGVFILHSFVDPFLSSCRSIQVKIRCKRILQY